MISSPHLVGPCTRDAGEFLDATTQLHVLVGGVKILKTRLDVRSNSCQGLPAQQDPWTPHAEILVVFQAQQTKLFLIASSCLPDELRLPAVH